jgi:cell division septation protein DedD
LQKAGFAAFLAPLEHDDRRSYRVRVGPAATRENAERLHARLAQTLGYTGMVVRNQ